MELKFDDLTVQFPFPYIYPEQLEYMKALKGALDESIDKMSRQALLEMPTGTGKTISLLSLIIAYQEHHKLEEKFIYCCRTINEVVNVAETFKTLMEYRQSKRPSAFNTSYRYVYMASRDHLCRHSDLGENLEAAHFKHHPLERCPFYDNTVNSHISVNSASFMNFEDYLVECNKVSICPYYLSREAINNANFVVCPYQYVLDPSVRAITGSAFQNSIVIFDEAHNIDSAALDTFSMRLGRKELNLAGQYVVELAREIETNASKFAAALKAESESLRANETLKHILAGKNDVEDRMPPVVNTRNGLLPAFSKNMSGSFYNASSFLKILLRLIEKLKNVQNRSPDPFQTQQMSTYTEHLPSWLVLELQEKDSVTQDELFNLPVRLASLSSTLSLVSNPKLSSLYKVVKFLALLACPSYLETVEKLEQYKGEQHNIWLGGSRFFTLFIERDIDTEVLKDESSASEPFLNLVCVSPMVALSSVYNFTRLTVMTSGTLSPISIFKRICGAQNCVTELSLEMSASRPLALPLVVSRGADQISMTTAFSIREEPAVIKNYGLLLIDLARNVPDGILVFCPSFDYMEEIISVWHDMRLLDNLSAAKLLFVESRNKHETEISLKMYRKACANGRGGMFFAVTRGRLSEGIDFDSFYGRTVVILGVPYANPHSGPLRAKMSYYEAVFGVKQGDLMNFDAMRAVAQCCGRVIRGKNDFAAIILADRRYKKNSLRSKMPPWLGNLLSDGHTDMNVEDTVNAVKGYLVDLSQPLSHEMLLGESIYNEMQANEHTQ